MVRYVIAAAACGVAAASLGCDGASSEAGTDPCDPENLIWVYSRIVDTASPAYPEAVHAWHDDAEARLTDDDAASAPAVSPDGQSIVFQRGSEGDPESAGYSRYRLYVMDGDGSHQRPLLTPANDSPERDDGAPRWDTGAVWSPDGSRVAFVRNSGFTEPGAKPGDVHQVMVVSADGGELLPLPGSTTLYEAGPAWSSDGERLAWIASEESEGSTLYWASADGTRSGSIPLSVDAYGPPAWVDDDGSIAVSYFADDDTQLADTELLKVDVASSETETLDVPMAQLWTLPTGELAGYESDVGDHTLVVIDDLDNLDSRQEILSIDRSSALPEGTTYDRTRGAATAVPDAPNGWAACTT
ncbi:MAG TPA: hypothetical protein VEX15_05005 [Nocardioidaceae bacterium]|nr:hypothetical protein [Nocardioidaceae bacterium]